MISPRMSYASTRVQSRFGALPDSQVWLSLSNAQNMAQFLQIAGTSDMALWVRKLGPESSVHAIEISIREIFRQHTAEVRNWMPSIWHDAFDWFSLLPDLEPVNRLMTNESLPAWTRDDPFLSSLSGSETGWPISLLTNNVQESNRRKNPGQENSLQKNLANHWRQIWEETWPAISRPDKKQMRHLIAFVPVSHWSASLLDKMIRFFRHNNGSPAGIFSYLVLVLTHLLRVRGELLIRAAFPGPER